MPLPANEREFYTEDTEEARVWHHARVNGTVINVLRPGCHYTGTVVSYRRNPPEGDFKSATIALRLTPEPEPKL
jgi:hypothetical protein